MKRFLVFSGDQYYPSGGWGDFQGGYDTLEEALASPDYTKADWGHIVDAESKAVNPIVRYRHDRL